MYSFKIEEKEFNIPTDWTELTLERYIDIVKLEQTKENYFIAELYLLKMIECLAGAEDGELDALMIEEVEKISKEIGFISETPEWPNTRFINIDGIDYVFSPDLNKLTMGEYISIKTFQENIKEEIDTIPYLLTIILRPGKKEVDESGNEKWVQNRFDANTIEDRKALFMKQPVFNLLGPITFFLNGKK